jgi:putative transposase
MPRRLCFAGGGYVYHVLNRAMARNRIFAKNRDYEALEEVLVEAKHRVPMRLLAWAVLPNHWHIVLWPRGDGHLSEFMRWMTVTHTQRCHAAHGCSHRMMLRGEGGATVSVDVLPELLPAAWSEP